MEFDLNSLPDLSSLSPEKLRSLLRCVEDFYEEIERQEPEDEESEDYEDWLNDLDEIEDLIEEINEKLEEES